MMAPQHPPQSPRPAKRSLMDWLFGRPPAPPRATSWMGISVRRPSITIIMTRLIRRDSHVARPGPAQMKTARPHRSRAVDHQA